MEFSVLFIHCSMLSDFVWFYVYRYEVCVVRVCGLVCAL